MRDDRYTPLNDDQHPPLGVSCVSADYRLFSHYPYQRSSLSFSLLHFFIKAYYSSGHNNHPLHTRLVGTFLLSSQRRRQQSTLSRFDPTSSKGIGKKIKGTHSQTQALMHRLDRLEIPFSFTSLRSDSPRHATTTLTLRLSLGPQLNRVVSTRYSIHDIHSYRQKDHRSFLLATHNDF